MSERLDKVTQAPKRAWDVVVKYTTDGCSFAPDFNFRDCCVQHDYDYAEYHRESEEKRAKIDSDLHLCIKCRAGAVLACIYWAAVRAFGWVPYWINKRRKRLTVEEDKAKNGYSGSELEDTSGGEHSDSRD